MGVKQKGSVETTVISRLLRFVASVPFEGGIYIGLVVLGVMAWAGVTEGCRAQREEASYTSRPQGTYLSPVLGCPKKHTPVLWQHSSNAPRHSRIGPQKATCGDENP